MGVLGRALAVRGAQEGSWLFPIQRSRPVCSAQVRASPRTTACAPPLQPGTRWDPRHVWAQGARPLGPLLPLRPARSREGHGGHAVCPPPRARRASAVALGSYRAEVEAPMLRSGALLIPQASWALSKGEPARAGRERGGEGGSERGPEMESRCMEERHGEWARDTVRLGETAGRASEQLRTETEIQRQRDRSQRQRRRERQRQSHREGEAETERQKTERDRDRDSETKRQKTETQRGRDRGRDRETQR